MEGEAGVQREGVKAKGKSYEGKGSSLLLLTKITPLSVTVITGDNFVNNYLYIFPSSSLASQHKGGVISLTPP
jgi:hypothetical protein